MMGNKTLKRMFEIVIRQNVDCMLNIIMKFFIYIFCRIH